MQFLHPLELKILLSVFLMVSMVSISYGQQSDLGQFENQTDVGDVNIPGSVDYDAESQTYTVKGSGFNMWGQKDAFHMVWKRMSGDMILRARTQFLGEGQHEHRKMGVIIRSSLEEDASYVDVAVHGDGLTSMQFRRSKGDSTEEVKSEVTAPDVIQLERKGNNFIMSVAKFGDTYTKGMLEGVELGDDVYVGIFVCSHRDDVAEKAVFRNVRMIKPAPEDLVQYQDYLGSNLEVMDIETGHRKILYRSPESLQAPNWTPDGKTLIYNSNGLLYKFDLKTLEPKVFDTGFAKNNNNDHVLSFDGRFIGISNHSEEHDGNSIIYTLPIEGGTPKQVTPQGPSYLHGWSPDNKYVTYTGGREEGYDIYKIPVDGGDEIRLTDAEGLDDGSEYSPDGKYIYFNSVRSGKMEIWRMRPDGSEPEQLTDDKYNNWFPHISPDGKKMVFLSFGPNVDPGDHPFYKRVYLRVMPVDGGSPKVVAYIYGGQGTINVPSWSPDSKRIGFVSNSGSIK